jgi:hypothetical protein
MPLPMMQIRTVTEKNPLEKLQRAEEYLRDSGVVKVETVGDTKGTRVFTLQYEHINSVPAYMPFSDYGSFSVSYDEKSLRWFCQADIFRAQIEFDVPKLFFTNLRSMVSNENGSKVQFLERAQYEWAKYDGDLMQFAHRLGRKMLNSGYMEYIEDGPHPVAHWKNTLDTAFDMWFTGYEVDKNVNPVFKFGYYEDPRLQEFDLTLPGMDLVMELLEKNTAQVKQFFTPLVEIF